MKIINRLILSSLLLATISCKDFLDPYPNNDRSGEDIWNYQESVQGLVGRAYDNISRNYNTNEGVYLDGATDDAVITSPTHAMRRLAAGTITTGQDPFLSYWVRDYQSIFLVNLFLKDDRGYKTRFLINSEKNDVLRRRLKGEAFALRAWFQWDLLKKYGGKGENGQLLGFPIVTEPLDIAQKIDYARNTYDECVQQIIADCDSAYKYLLLANRDFLVKDPSNLLYLGGRNWGRMDGITTVAIKADLYLTWASPRFNPQNLVARWDSAAVNAKKVIDFKLTVDGGVTGGFNPVSPIDWSNPNSPEIILSARNVAADETLERMFYPGGFQGNGVIGATQDLVDDFPMANGFPIRDPRSGYNPAKPYEGRDPRFYSNIFYNKAAAKRNHTGATMYTFENWKNGGKDAAGLVSNNSLTNYHIKKFIFMGYNRLDAAVNRQPRSVFYYRWTDMILAFAEAANRVVGPTDDARYGMSAKTAIQYLRARSTQAGSKGISPAVPGKADTYLNEAAGLGQAAFEELVRTERRLETCFEGKRFFDLRRWSTDLNGINTTVYGVDVVKESDTTFVYRKTAIEKRSYTSAFLPIPYSEVLRMSRIVQNEGWEGWN